MRDYVVTVETARQRCKVLIPARAGDAREVRMPHQGPMYPVAFLDGVTVNVDGDARPRGVIACQLPGSAMDVDPTGRAV